jgi:hypothetical protein
VRCAELVIGPEPGCAVGPLPETESGREPGRVPVVAGRSPLGVDDSVGVASVCCRQVLRQHP